MASSLRRVSRSCIVAKKVVISSFSIVVVVVVGGGGGRTKGRRGNQFPEEDVVDVDEDAAWCWAGGDLVSSNSSNACIEVVEDSSVLLLLL